MSQSEYMNFMPDAHALVAAYMSGESDVVNDIISSIKDYEFTLLAFVVMASTLFTMLAKEDGSDPLVYLRDKIMTFEKQRMGLL